MSIRWDIFYQFSMNAASITRYIRVIRLRLRLATCTLVIATACVSVFRYRYWCGCVMRAVLAALAMLALPLWLDSFILFFDYHGWLAFVKCTLLLCWRVLLKLVVMVAERADGSAWSYCWAKKCQITEVKKRKCVNAWTRQAKKLHIKWIPKIKKNARLLAEHNQLLNVVKKKIKHISIVHNGFVL